jgi:phospholipid/cholesterol/gamma-HCH transport system substrate-binding protein
MKVSKYTRLGILIVVSIAILIWGLSYLKGRDIFKKHNLFHVIYERVDGLEESNKVVLNGYQVGQVSDIGFSPHRMDRLIVTFTVDSKIKVPLNSVAQIVSSDLMGTRSINIILSDQNEYHLPNDTIAGSVENDLREQVSMQVLPIKNKAEQLLGTLDSAITVLTVIFNEDARNNLSESFENINRTIENLERTTSDLQSVVSSEKDNVKEIITNFKDITNVFNQNTAQLENVITNMSSFSDTLSQIKVTPVLNNILSATNNINAVIAKLNQDDNTAGLLLNDEKLYNSISLLSSDLGSLIRDIQNNPQRYLQFSAIDLGKDVYVNTGESALAPSNIIFKVHLVSTENKVPLTSDRFKELGKIEEYEASGAFSYLIGETNSYNEITKIHEKARKFFPDASIVAFKNGRLIKLEKALKSLR